MDGSSESRTGVSYLLFILFLSACSILLLFAETFVPMEAGAQAIVDYADTLVCLLFIMDFFITLARADRKLRYLYTWGWLDLLSSIPAVNVLRIGRLSRVVRILRVLRGIRSGRVLALFILERRTHSTFLAASLLCLLLLFFGSIAVLQFEQAPDSNIHGAGDAFWWSIVTLTTVGYGDLYPVTLEGRAVAVVLMLAGVGLFGMLSGFVASWFLSPEEKEQENEIHLLRREIGELRSLIERRNDLDRE